MNKKQAGNYSDYLFWIILVVGILSRIYFLVFHFTHIDDIGAINHIIALGKSGNNNIKSGVLFSKDWSYAPVQMILTSIVTNPYMGYRSNLILGRLWSAIFGMATVCIFVVWNKTNKKDELNKYILMTMALFSLSWENIIYSSQACPYEVVVFMSLIVIIIAKMDLSKWTKDIIIAVALSCGCYFHYQFFLIVFAYYVAIFFTYIKNKDKLKKIIPMGMISVGFTVPLLIFMVSNGKFDQNLNWNRGIGDQFLFSVTASEENPIVYFIKFFSKNTFLIFKYFFTSNEFTVLSSVMAVVLIILALGGIIYIHYVDKVWALFDDILLLVTLCMVMRGTLAYGPSRHMLYMFPVFVLQIMVGLRLVGKILSWVQDERLCIVISGLLLFMFLLSLPTNIVNRTSHISQEKINSLISMYSPDIVFGLDYTGDLYLMKFDEYDNYSVSHGRNIGWCQKYNDTTEENTLMLISRNETIDQFLSDEETNQYFYDRLQEFGIDGAKYDFSTFSIVYKEVIDNNTEVEYASEWYTNYPNGLHLYILQM